MNVTRVFQSLAVELAVVVCVTAVLAGCNSAEQQGDESQPAAELAAEDDKLPPVDPSPPPIDPSSPPVVALPEPGYGDLVDPLADGMLPSAIETEPTTTVVALPPEQEPEQNPLRAGREPGLRDSLTPRPDVTELAAAGGGPVADGTHRKSAFDPIKENGPIFTDWPKPKLALVITGRLEGYIEPCGCAGLEKMMGGLSRRHTFLKQLRAPQGQLVAGKLLGKGWPVVAVDVGGTAKRHGKQARWKFEIMVDSIKEMDYDAIALGKTDLKLPAEELLRHVARIEGQPALFVSANVALFPPSSYIEQLTVVQKGGMKLGIVSVLGKKYQEQILGQFVAVSDPEAALKEVLPGLKKQADFLVLLAHATMKETAELKKKFPEFDVVVTADGAAEPPDDLEREELPVIEVGEKGKYAIVLGFYGDPNQPVRYQRVPLDSRFPGSKEMKTLMTLYQDRLEAEWAEYAKQKLPHPQRELNGTFVGSKKCGDCHEKSYAIWRKTGHAKAYRTLAELDPPRTFDPECISCHVVGWDTEGYFAYRGGYQSFDGMPKLDGTPTMQATPELINVGCESCHGPGSAHSKAEEGNDKQLQKKLQQALKITKAEAEDVRSGKHHCYLCHDLENSPEFKFETYWPKIEHYENED